MEREAREEERKPAEQSAEDAGQHIPGRRGVMFSETMKTLARLSSSYRRCHWKSAAELIFPLLYEHLTFASHRTWKLFVKKAIFFTVTAWRKQYGESVLHAVDGESAQRDPVIYRRAGVDDVVLAGWQKVSRIDEDTGDMSYVYIGPGGQACTDLAEAFLEFESQQPHQRSARQRLSIAEELLKLHTVTEDVDRSGQGEGASTNLRALQATGEDVAVTAGVGTIAQPKYLSVTTSSLEDYLYRGDSELLAGMSWATYGTWVYRIELPARPEKSVRGVLPRYVDVYFDPAYKLYNSHAQRICSEPRVPMFEGFTMPALTVDSERNAMYKQIQCRPTRILQLEDSDLSQDELVMKAFALYSSPVKGSAGMDNSIAATTAFTRAFLEWEEDMVQEAATARYRFATRFEYPSLWETKEMFEALHWKLEAVMGEELPQPSLDPDRKKPRATVAQYSSMLAESRIAHLEGWL